MTRAELREAAKGRIRRKNLLKWLAWLKGRADGNDDLLRAIDLVERLALEHEVTCPPR